VLARVGQVEEVVRDGGPLGGGRLGRADVHAPIDLHRVDGHDLDVAEGLGRRQGHGRLPGGGGPDQGEVGDGGGREARRHGAASGIRTRRAGSAVLRTNVPRRKCGAAESTATSAKAPGRSPAPSGARKWTSLFCLVRPVVMAGSFLDGPSTRTSSRRPTRASWRRSADRSTTSVRRRIRSAVTSAGTKSSTQAAASVPGRGENTNV